MTDEPTSKFFGAETIEAALDEQPRRAPLAPLETSEQRAGKRMRDEVAEFEADQRAQAQAQLDHWWQSKLDLEAEHRRMMRQLNEFGLKIW
jgi:hypothetical protein